MIRTLDPRFPKPVLYQAELYPEFRLDPLPERAQKGNMVDLSRRWPLGLGDSKWWVPLLAALVILALALAFDRQLSVWARGWPDYLLVPLEEITRYGESDWILYPSAIFFLLTAAVALFVRWKLMRTLLWQFAALYGFIFAGVALPSLVSTLIKRLIGRGRPEQFDQFGLLSFQPNWLDWTFQSFPSGHSTTAFALAGVLGFLAPRWFVPALGLALVIGISRVAVGAHYPSDVFAGAILGLLGAYTVRWLFAKRGWIFRETATGGVVARPIASLRRYLTLKRRGTAPARPTDRP